MTHGEKFYEMTRTEKIKATNESIKPLDPRLDERNRLWEAIERLSKDDRADLMRSVFCHAFGYMQRSDSGDAKCFFGCVAAKLAGLNAKPKVAPDISSISGKPIDHDSFRMCFND